MVLLFFGNGVFVLIGGFFVTERYAGAVGGAHADEEGESCGWGWG